jgi:hypothetical protein
MQESKEINGFTLVNAEKIERALHGTMGKGGELNGGVGDKAKPEDLLAEYDRLGGLILKDGRKVKTGSFYDFDKKEARETPQVILILKDLEGETVELDGDAELTPELKAAEVIAERKRAKQAKQVEEADEKQAKVAAGKKAKAKKKAAVADEDEE